VKPGEEIAIGTATDPYQPAEKYYEVTRAILEELTRHQGLRLGIITKSNLVLRDIDLLKKIARLNYLGVHVTITTLNVDLARMLEPRAPRPDLRLDAVRELNLAGIQVGVNCSPVLPGISDSPRDLEAVVRATAKAGGQNVFANPLFLKPCSAAVFFPFLEKEFPQLAENYRRRYQDSAFLPKAYSQRLSQLMSRLREKYGMQRNSGRDHGRLPAVAAAETQLELF
jgi:DNA repair photolyase